MPKFRRICSWKRKCGGSTSHGLLRLRRVIERIHGGLSVPATTGKHIWWTRNFLQVDGERGLGRLSP